MAEEDNYPDTEAEPKTAPVCSGKTASPETKPAETKSGRKLEWQEVNAVTWRLIDLDASQIRLEASHGQWGGYQYPKALAYVFDVDVNDYDWRIRVRQRGNRWQAWGCVIDLPTAKRMAQQAVENPKEPRPSKFSIPLNLLGGERQRADALMLLDPQTCDYVRYIEIGAVKAEAANEQSPAADDDTSINTCATDDEVEQQRLRDLADETMGEAIAGS